LPGDEPIAMTGNMRETRRPNWERGVQNMRYVLQELRRMHPALDYRHLLLMGHSNGGDMAALQVAHDQTLAARGAAAGGRGAARRPRYLAGLAPGLQKSMVSQLRNVSQSPNLDYLAHYLHKPFYQLLLDTNPKRVVERLHPDGWLEIALPPPTADPALLRRRTAEKLATYRPIAANSRLAAVRLLSFWQTIALLKQHGQVVLVRLPTGPAMAALEDDYQPSFDQLMSQTAARQHITYLSYLNAPYATNDGNHLTRTAAEQFSQRLAADIAQLAALTEGQ
nr:hypothetical protein [Tanacetum cinerariifolium]